MLLKAAFKTGGDIIELGIGRYSTPLLHEVAVAQRRRLFSYDNNMEWFSQFLYLENNLHKLYQVRDWKSILPEPCGLLFVDQAPGICRGESITSFRGCADVIVMHDTEDMIQYGYDKVLGTFKYEYTDKSQKVWTTVASDTTDITGWTI